MTSRLDEDFSEHDDERRPRKRYISCSDRMCGSPTCPKCNPWNFRAGVFIADCDSEEAED